MYARAVVCLAALCVAVSLGLAFAYAHKETLAHNEHSFPPSGLWQVVGFGVLFFSPTLCHLIANNLAWSVSYWFDPSTLPAFVMVAWYFCLAAVPVTSYLLGAWLLRQAQNPLFLTLFVGALLTAAGCIVVGYPRLAVVGSYHKFHHSFGLAPLSGSDVGMTILWIIVVHVAVVAWTFHSLSTLHAKSFRRPTTRHDH